MANIFLDRLQWDVDIEQENLVLNKHPSALGPCNHGNEITVDKFNADVFNPFNENVCQIRLKQNLLILTHMDALRHWKYKIFKYLFFFFTKGALQNFLKGMSFLSPSILGLESRYVPNVKYCYDNLLVVL